MPVQTNPFFEIDGMLDQHSDEDDVTSDTLDLFEEPNGFYKSDEAPTFRDFILRNGRSFHLRLVGHNPLWGHLLWNAGQIITNYLEENFNLLVSGRAVLELGAGGGLPSLTCAVLGAETVVVTDYPDPELISNLEYNIDNCLTAEEQKRISAQGFLWGNDPSNILKKPGDGGDGFDVLILADILFNHSEHSKLLASVQATMNHNENAVALVFFTPYRPWLLEKDLNFFDLARADGFHVEKVLEHTMDKVMFENDGGDEKLRRTVFGYTLRRGR